jgi:uncharacterized membrane protein YdbT with pleckstrin-like domain
MKIVSLILKIIAFSILAAFFFLTQAQLDSLGSWILLYPVAFVGVFIWLVVDIISIIKFTRKEISRTE